MVVVVVAKDSVALVDANPMPQRVHYIWNVATTQTLSDKVEHHWEVCESENNPEHHDNHVQPLETGLEATGNEITKPNGGQCDEAIVEAVEKGPVLDMREQVCGNDEKDT